METTEKCGHCAAMSEAGVCRRIGKEVGYFAHACKDFTPRGSDTREEAEHKQMKKCANCGSILPLSAFKKHNKGTFGRVAVCNECKGGSIKPQGEEKKKPEKKKIAKADDVFVGDVKEHLTDSDLILELGRRGVDRQTSKNNRDNTNR